MTTISRAVASAAKNLETANIDTARLDAEVLLAFVLEIDRSMLLLNSDRELPEADFSAFEKCLTRRAKGEPVARILGRKEFWSLDFEINQDTLVPRPESETLVESILNAVHSTPAGTNHKWKILDLGTGSGCLLLSLLSELERAEGVGVDCAEGAVDQARENALRLELSERARFKLADWREAPTGAIMASAPYDFILSNPPYIRSDEFMTLPVEVRGFDPVLALDGGKKGLDCLPYILNWASQLLVGGGVLALETGAGQARSVKKMMEKEGFEDIQIISDLSGIGRVARCRKF